MTNYSRSVLLSNGLHHSENLPVKFGFSLKIVPANIVQKLPSQRCSKPLFIAFFNFSHKWPTFAFADESGYTLGFAQRIAHSGSHGETGGLPSPGHNAALCCQRNCSVIPLDSAVLLYTYISRFSVDPNYQQREKIRQSCRINFIPNRFSFRFSTSRTNGPRLPSPPKAGTYSPLLKGIAHKGTHGETGVFWMGALSLPSDCFTRFGNPAWPGIRTAHFAVFGSWPGVCQKDAESLRDSDALMRVAVPRRRSPAGLRDLFSFLTKLRLVRPIPETSFSSPDAPACAVPAQAAFPLALSRLGAVQGFSVLSLCLTPFLDFEDKKRPLTIRIVRPVNGLIFDVHFLCSVQQT